jgi:hypothetical protein
VVAEYETGHMVIKDGTTNILVFVSFFTSSVVMPSTDRALVLVKGDTLTGFELVAGEYMLFGGKIMSMFGVGGSLLGFCLAACETEWDGAICNRSMASRKTSCATVFGATI